MDARKLVSMTPAEVAAQAEIEPRGYELASVAQLNGQFVATAIKRVNDKEFRAAAGGPTPVLALRQLVRTVKRP
jgi:hypothetical protein